MGRRVAILPRRVSEILEHEWLRLSAGQPLRTASDLVTRVEIVLAPGSERRVGSLLRSGRLTDEWRWTPGKLVGLLYGTDEEGAQQVLARLGLAAGGTMAVARSHDLLGDVPMLVAARGHELTDDIAEMRKLDPIELADAFEAEVFEADPRA